MVLSNGELLILALQDLKGLKWVAAAKEVEAAAAKQVDAAVAVVMNNLHHLQRIFN